MIKEIKYNGFTETPSDYESPDGDLASALNLVNEEGAMSPVFSPSQLFTLDDGDKVAYIHVNTNYEHYIIQSGKSLYWFDGSIIPAPSPFHFSTTQNSSKLIATLDSDILEVKSIGNVLVVLTAKCIEYIYWKDGAYKDLGSHIPEIPLSFGLQGDMVRGDEFTINFDNIEFFDGDIWMEFTEDNKRKITEQVLAKVNKFIAEKSTNDGKFIYPFFVRYALRLYDQSLIMHSAPILMVCSSDLAPQCFVVKMHGEDTSTAINEATLRIASMVHKLDYAVIGQQYITALDDWKDIVKSVDVFVSKPIYTYKQSGECTKFVKTNYSDCYCICKHTNQTARTSIYPLRYQKANFAWLYAKTFDAQELRSPVWRLMLPTRDNEDIKADIIDNAQFYLLKSISIDELTTERTVIPISKEYLQSLVNREVMSDDFDSHDSLIANYSFPFNSRLNIANLKKTLFSGFNAAAMFEYTNGYVANYSDASPTIMDRTYPVNVTICIRQDGKEIVVRGDSYSFGYNTPFLFLFYPNVNAYKAIIAINDYIPTYYQVPLTPHPTLNGAFYYGDWEGIAIDEHKVSSLPSVSSDRSIFLPNKIYTSEVNNPFYFPTLGINTVGTGNILGICAAVKALSQGQFGQFPLYAFTDEGVWALEVSSEGKYTAKQPVTRDVCIHNNSITQIDTAVLFATDRGIMLIQGANSQCISDILNSKHSFNVDDLPNLKSILGNEVANQLDFIPFSDFIKNCRMLYDYTHQRIFVYNVAQTYSYVYSLKSKKWGIVHSNIQESINSYPNALALCLKQVAEGVTINCVVDFSVDDDAIENMQCVLVTRPLKLDAPDLLKTVGVIIQRGQFRHGSVKTILYGSRDLFNWHYIYSSQDHYLRGFRGTPYKYFRVVLICDLKQDESIFGCTVSFTPRYINQPR